MSTGKSLIWKSPIYKFIIPAGFDDSEERIYKEVNIDVTASVPSFDEPGKPMKAVLEGVLRN